METHLYWHIGIYVYEQLNKLSRVKALALFLRTYTMLRWRSKWVFFFILLQKKIVIEIWSVLFCFSSGWVRLSLKVYFFWGVGGGCCPCMNFSTPNSINSEPNTWTRKNSLENETRTLKRSTRIPRHFHNYCFIRFPSFSVLSEKPVVQFMGAVIGLVAVLNHLTNLYILTDVVFVQVFVLLYILSHIL